MPDILPPGASMPSERVFFGTAALVFTTSVMATIVEAASMSAMAGMPMPGGWTMSMMWMPMCGQTWFGTAASFLGMWMVMMAAMMLPSLVPMLWRYRRALGEVDAMPLDRFTAVSAGGYFFVWSMVGVVAFVLGSALMEVAMRLPALARTIPFATGMVVLSAGALQFTVWKVRHLAHCRDMPICIGPSALCVREAWRHGLRLGFHCTLSCAGPTAILLVVGVMDLRVMAIVTVAITAERLAPIGERIARATGAGAVCVGLLAMAYAA